jgi:hypothetical protein
MSRVFALVALAAVVLLALAAAAGASSPEVHAAKSCHLSPYEQKHMGATYVTSLSVRHVSCKTGKAVVRAYQKCRRHHGYMGRCGHAAGYSCKRHLIDKSAVAYDAKVTCRRGVKRVVHTYQQDK